MNVVGQIVAGKTANILIREKSGEEIELGDLLVAEEENAFSILQVSDLNYASQIPRDSRELLAGMKLEGYGASLDFMEPELRNYILAEARAIARVTNHGGEQKLSLPKTLPSFFNSIRHLSEEDVKFFQEPERPLYLGQIRSGSKILDVDVNLEGEEVLPHHVLVPAATGKGKSNLVKVILWDMMNIDAVGSLVLDPHDEYFGRHEPGLKDHKEASEKMVYYSPGSPPRGGVSLRINLGSIRPSHFAGIVNFTDAQKDAIYTYYNHYREDWVPAIIRGEEVQGVQARTLGVLRRKFDIILGVYQDDESNIRSRNEVFTDSGGDTTKRDIVRALESGKTVILDTSRLMGEAELLIGSIVAGEMLNRYQRYKSEGKLHEKPILNIVLEEAPRVLSEKVLASGENIYSTIAREGRKFNIGLLAVTQLTSLIPREILANMNTKIILGNEMGPERRAIIESASQDLSADDRNIASLDKGEAIVSTNFTKFAVPIRIPLFEELAKKEKKEKEELVFEG